MNPITVHISKPTGRMANRTESSETLQVTMSRDASIEDRANTFETILRRQTYPDAALKHYYEQELEIDQQDPID